MILDTIYLTLTFLLSKCPIEVNTISGFSFDNCDILANFVSIMFPIPVYR